MTCINCGNKDIVYTYKNQNDPRRSISDRDLCENCFKEEVENKVFKVLNEANLNSNSRIVLGLSGGKDSQIMLNILMQYFKKTNINPKLFGLLADEGIAEFRQAGRIVAEKSAKQFGVPLKIISFIDSFGITVDQVAKAGGIAEYAPCGVCCKLSNYIYRLYANEVKATHFSIGLSLDDQLAYYLFSLSLEDGELLRRSYFKTTHKKYTMEFSYLFPIRTLKGKEIKLYNKLSNIEFHSSPECPNKVNYVGKPFREAVDFLDEKFPNYSYSCCEVLSKTNKEESLDLSNNISCQECGEYYNPNKSICACKYLEGLKDYLAKKGETTIIPMS